MECLTTDQSTLSFCLQHYGSFALFGLLMLGIIALPIPEETLMVVSGFLMYKGKIPIPQTMIAAYMGSLCGITVSYIIGRSLGLFFVHKVGRFVGITEKRLQMAHNWFERFGKWSLFFGYFIPGVRHFSGLLSGITKLHYKQFAIFAYSGAILWVSLFLSIGYFLHNAWDTIYKKIEVGTETVVVLAVVLGAIITFIYLLKKKKK